MKSLSTSLNQKNMPELCLRVLKSLIFIGIVATLNSCQSSSLDAGNYALSIQEVEKFMEKNGLDDNDYDLTESGLKVYECNHGAVYYSADYIKDDLLMGNWFIDELEHGSVTSEIEYRQRGKGGWHLTTMENVKDIKFYSDLPAAEWEVAITHAITQWNNSGSAVNLSRTYDENDYDLRLLWEDLGPRIVNPSGSEESFYYAIGAYPRYGEVGDIITCNSNSTIPWTPFKRKTILTHEFGHNLGFEHSDLAHFLIANTPAVDSNSIMNSYTNDTGKLSNGDKTMVRKYYPKNLKKPTYVTAERIGPGNVRIKYKNEDKDQNPFFWVRIRKYDINDNHLQSKWVQSDVNSNGIQYINWYGHDEGTYIFRVEGYNRRRDERGPRSNKKTVTL